MSYLIVSSKSWNYQLPEILKNKIGGEWNLITEKKDFTPEAIKEINPEKIFIPHWSHIIPAEIYGTYECIVFHMTDLPYGRGGSPLQNLVVRGHTETKVSAIRVSKELDAGDVYLKMNLSLYGTAEEIFMRSSSVITEMIEKIITKNIQPKPQEGKAVLFKRRKPEESNISELSNLGEVYDYIRMLDAEGYPKAFLETETFRFEFSRASLKADNSIIADVKIIKK